MASFVRTAGLFLAAFFFVTPKLPRNRFAGLRFSYTLADDEVWRGVHRRCRWFFLLLAAVCFAFPVNSLPTLLAFTWVIAVILIVTVITSYLCAKRLYVDKFGTSEVVSRGLLRYEPPDRSAGEHEPPRAEAEEDESDP